MSLWASTACCRDSFTFTFQKLVPYSQQSIYRPLPRRLQIQSTQSHTFFSKIGFNVILPYREHSNESSCSINCLEYLD
jgi:hypothetical protein